VRDLERERIAGELHENVAQYLAGVGMYISYARNLGVAPNIEVQRFLDDGYALLRQCSTDMQSMAADLYPSELKDFGLVAAIKSRVGRLQLSQGIDVNLDIPPDIPRPPPDHELALYRAMDETLTNACRRLGGMTATIRVFHDASEVGLEVFDASCELRPLNASEIENDPKSAWIKEVRERVRNLGGHFAIASGINGTTVRAVLPLRPK
jgi:signal transduction histidine kinase